MTEEQIQVGWRIKVGFALFIASIAWPVLLPIMPVLGFSGSSIGTFSGAMLLVAEVMILVGAAIAGKDGFAFIKSKVFGFLKPYGPPKKVSPSRYRLGLVLFVLILLLGWGSPYFGGHLPGFQAYPLIYAVAGDIVLLISLLILGGDFWDKLRSLFIHGAYAVIPSKHSTHDPAR
jgi:hypothetical protein